MRDGNVCCAPQFEPEPDDQFEWGVRGEVSAMIADVETWRPANEVHRQFSRHAATADGCGDDGRQALLDIIDHVQDAQAPAGRELVEHEIDGPAAFVTASTTIGARVPVAFFRPRLRFTDHSSSQ